MRNRVHDLMVDFGNGVVAGTGTRIGILDYDGLSSLVAESSIVEYAMQDGGYVAATRAGTRRLMFALDFGDTDIGWADVPRLFPLGGVLPLTITRDGVTRRVVAVRDTDLVPLGGGGALDPVSCQIALLAPEPYLLRDTSEVRVGNGAVGGLAFPIEFGPSIKYEDTDSSENVLASIGEFDPAWSMAGSDDFNRADLGADWIISRSSASWTVNITTNALYIGHSNAAAFWAASSGAASFRAKLKMPPNLTGVLAFGATDHANHHALRARVDGGINYIDYAIRASGTYTAQQTFTVPSSFRSVELTVVGGRGYVRLFDTNGAHIAGGDFDFALVGYVSGYVGAATVGSYDDFEFWTIAALADGWEKASYATASLIVGPPSYQRITGVKHLTEQTEWHWLRTVQSFSVLPGDRVVLSARIRTTLPSGGFAGKPFKLMMSLRMLKADNDVVVLDHELTPNYNFTDYSHEFTIPADVVSFKPVIQLQLNSTAEDGFTARMEVDSAAAFIESKSAVLRCVNDGDYPVGFRLDVDSRAATEMKLLLGDTSMEIATIASGQRLSIDTTRKLVMLNGENAFHLLKTWDWPVLPVGPSTLIVEGLIGMAVLEFTPVFEAV